jgi:hypothetical protein
MIILSIVCLIGVLIGLHYNVLAVIPVTLVVVIISCIGAAINGYTTSGILLSMLGSAFGLHGGYVIGLSGRGLLGQFLSRAGVPQSRRM